MIAYDEGMTAGARGGESSFTATLLRPPGAFAEALLEDGGGGGAAPAVTGPGGRSEEWDGGQGSIHPALTQWSSSPDFVHRAEGNGFITRRFERCRMKVRLPPPLPRSSDCERPSITGAVGAKGSGCKYRPDTVTGDGGEQLRRINLPRVTAARSCDAASPHAQCVQPHTRRLPFKQSAKGLASTQTYWWQFRGDMLCGTAASFLISLKRESGKQASALAR